MTIEERVKEYTKRYDEYDRGNCRDTAERAYIQGATEQRKLDIIRMRQWLEREYAYNGSMAVITPDMIDEFCEAMEEE